MGGGGGSPLSGVGGGARGGHGSDLLCTIKKSNGGGEIPIVTPLVKNRIFCLSV